MGFFLVKSPLAIAIGAALIQPGQVVELDDEEGARLIANGTVDEAQMAPEDQAAYDAAKAAAGIPPNEPMVSVTEDQGAEEGVPDATEGAAAEPAATEPVAVQPAATQPAAATPKPAASGRKKA